MEKFLSDEFTKTLGTKTEKSPDSVEYVNSDEGFFCDLHTHSIYSDGTCTPKELVHLAKKENLRAVALCDHNTVSGLHEFILEVDKAGIKGVAGTEISVEYNGKELHLLGLFIDRKDYAYLESFFIRFKELKEASNVRLVDNLKKAGYKIDYEKIKVATPKGHVNRAHIAAALLENGYVGSAKEAFKNILSSKHGFYQPPERPDVFGTIKMLKGIGAVPVLAHPFLNLNYEELEVFLPLAKEQGLKGIEVYYSLYDEKTTKQGAELAKRFDLICSGGSDFHGKTKPDIMLGKGKGNLRIPIEAYFNLLQAKKDFLGDDY